MKNTFRSRSSESPTNDDNLQSLDNDSGSPITSFWDLFDTRGGLFGMFQRFTRAVEEFGGFGKQADQQWRQVLGYV